MRQYFGGWRRKLGVVALVLACVSLAGWVRSTRLTDKWTPHTARNPGMRFDFLASHDGYIEWRSFYRVSQFRVEPLFRFETSSNSDTGLPCDTCGGITRYHRRFFGVESILVAVGANDDDVQYWKFKIPYLFIVFPLTFVSAWLLLSKPQFFVRSSPANIEPRSA